MMINIKKLFVASTFIAAASMIPETNARNTDNANQTNLNRNLQGNNDDDEGAVYVMSNRVNGAGNSVIIFKRNNNGTLQRVGLVDTGGFGGLGDGLAGFPGGFPNTAFGTPNDALASQNSLLLSQTKRCLFAANAGSDTVTTFRVDRNGQSLDRIGVYHSGGSFPVSITQFNNIVYVLNAGSDATVSGFRYNDRTCELSSLNIVRSLNNVNTNPPFFLLAPAQVSITPDGTGLVATLKGMNNIHYWSLSNLGFPSDEQVITESNGFTPFSFTFDDNGNLLVSEAFGVAPFAPPPPTENNGAVSSYSINDDGTLSLISGSVPTGQTATCWIRHFNGYAYTTNNDPPRPSVSIFSVDNKGRLGLVESVAADGEQGIDRPIDFDLTDDGKYLYALSTGSIQEESGAGQPAVSVFKNNGPTLDLVEVFTTGLPLSTTTPTFDETQGVFGLEVF